MLSVKYHCVYSTLCDPHVFLLDKRGRRNPATTTTPIQAHAEGKSASNFDSLGLESQFAVEVLHTCSVLTSVEVSVLKCLLDCLLGLHSSITSLLHGLGLHMSLDINVGDGVTSGHQMIQVDELDERLQVAALLDLSNTVTLSHLHSNNKNNSNSTNAHNQRKAREEKRQNGEERGQKERAERNGEYRGDENASVCISSSG